MLTLNTIVDVRVNAAPPANPGTRFSTGLILAPASGDTVTEINGDIEEMLRRHGFAGVIFFAQSLTETEASVTGYPSLPNGRLANKIVTLPLKEWTLCAQPHDPVIGVHIPAVDPLDYDECKAAIEQARDFFPRYCPEFHFKGFACSSWLLDPTLQDFLPKTSNIVRFQSLFNLYPSPDGNAWQTRERVFGDPDLPLDKVPLKTSLQRIVHDQILNGHRFRSGNMFLPR